MGLFHRRSPEEKFAAQVLEAVRATGGIAEASVDSEQFAIRFRRSNGQSGWIYLHNTFLGTAGTSHPERERRIHRLVQSLVHDSVADLGWEGARPLLRPVLRGAAFGQVGQVGSAPLSRPVLPYLAELVVIDQPTSMAYVNADRVAEWGVSADEIFATARANLSEPAARLAGGRGPDGPALLRFVDDGDGYFTSMLLVDGFLAGLAPRVGGRPVAFAPDKDTLCVVTDDASALPRFFGMMEEQFTQATRRLSPMGYTVDSSGAVIPYATEEPGELASAVHRAEVLLAASEYGAQKEALDARHRRDGVDVYVSSVLVARNPDGSVFSVSVWGDDCDTLLPVADYVGFPSADESLTVPWPIVASEVRLRPEPGLVPARYRVTAWPPEPVMTRLRAEAVTP